MVTINIQPPKIILGNEKNLTLNFHLEKVSVPGLIGEWGSYHTFNFPGVGQLRDDQNTANSTFTPEVNRWTNTPEFPHYNQFSMSLDLLDVDIGDLEMEQMPGFRFSWSYTGAELEVENIYRDVLADDDILTTYNEFVRTVYI